MRNLFRNWGPPKYEPTDWPKRMAECEVRLAMAIGFLRTIPGDNTSAEEGEAWRGRLACFLAHNDGVEEGRTDD